MNLTYAARYCANKKKPFKLRANLFTSINYLASSVAMGRVTFAELKKEPRIPKAVLRNAMILYCNLKNISLPEALKSRAGSKL